MKEWFQKNSKAIAAAVGSGLVALGTGILVGEPTEVTGEEWAAVLAAVLLPFGITWVSPANKPPV